jgi:hypothetical protein
MTAPLLGLPIAALEMGAGLDPGTPDFPQLDPFDYGIFPRDATLSPDLAPDINFDALPVDYPAVAPGSLTFLPFPAPTAPPPDLYTVPQLPVFTPIDPSLVPTGVPVPDLPPLPQLEPPVTPIILPTVQPAGPTPAVQPSVPNTAPFGPAPSPVGVPLAPPYVVPAPPPQTTPATTPASAPARSPTPRANPLPEPTPQPTTQPQPQPQPQPRPSSVPESVPLTVPRSFTVPFNPVRPGRRRAPAPAPEPMTQPVPQPAGTPAEQCECQSNDQNKKRKCGEGYFKTTEAGKTTYTYWSTRCGKKDQSLHHGKRKYKWRSSKAHSASRPPVPLTTY